MIDLKAHKRIRRRIEPGTTCEVNVEQLARNRLAQRCPYWFYYRDLNFDLAHGVLTVNGCVGSNYLRQLLQQFLRGMDGVQRIDNQVDVVSATGLSSVRSKSLTSRSLLSAAGKR